MTTHGDDGDIVISGARAGFPPAPLRAAVRRVLRGEGHDAVIALNFLTPRAMAALNAQAFGHHGPTDVISFALPQPDGTLLGDIYLCRAVAVRHAREHGSRVRDELIRLAIHGTLHVLGWDHPGGAARMRSPMWARQERYLREGA